MNKTFIFGDSITWGASDEMGGWATRLKVYSDKRSAENEDYYNPVYVLGVSGDKTEDVLSRFESEIQVRIDDEDNRVIIFAVGINDTQVPVGEKQPIVSPEQFRLNMTQLVRLARKYSDTIFVLSLTPIDEERVNPMPWKPTHGYTEAEITKFNAILKEIGEQLDIEFIDVYNHFLRESNHKSLLHDGLHPNTKGHELMYHFVLQKLLEKQLL